MQDMLFWISGVAITLLIAALIAEIFLVVDIFKYIKHLENKIKDDKLE